MSRTRWRRYKGPDRLLCVLGGVRATSPVKTGGMRIDGTSTGVPGTGVSPSAVIKPVFSMVYGQISRHAAGGQLCCCFSAGQCEQSSCAALAGISGHVNALLIPGKSSATTIAVRASRSLITN